MTRLLDLSAPVETSALPDEAVVSGAPSAGSRSLAEIGGVEVGVWEMSPGAATDVEVDEVFVVLSGSATVTFEDGETIELAPGVAVRLRAGDRTTWVVHSALRKVYLA